MLLKTLTVLSLAANCLLAGFLVYSRPQEKPSQPVCAQVRLPADSRQSEPAPGKPEFQWENLESNEYPTYIQNLRSVKCPEPTIRAIIAADLDGLYAEKADTLLTQGLTSFDLASARESLHNEQAAVFNFLFPSISSASESVVRNSLDANPASNNTVAANDQPIMRPLIYGQPDPSIQQDQFQFNAWKNLQQRFIDEVGGLSQNPYDPEYRKRWTKAQDELDEVFHAQFGDESFNALVLQRNAKANLPEQE